jgi:hypothetical protein
MLTWMANISCDQWIRIGLAILTLVTAGSFIAIKISKTNKAKVGNVKNSKLDIKQDIK